jgi:UDP-N-acetyl-D-glucosamine dehydrogenase
VLVLGVAFKRDVDDLRESPALEVMRLLQEKGARLAYHDPFCPVIADDGHTPLLGLPMESRPLDGATLRAADVVVVITDHTSVDYARVAREARLVMDTRGVLRGVPGTARVVGLSAVRPPARLPA